MQVRPFLFLSLLALLALVSFAGPATAYCPPCQDVTGPSTLSLFGNLSVNFSVVNPVNNQPIDYSIVMGPASSCTVDQLTQNQGIVAWRLNQNNNYSIYWATFDPVRGWQVANSGVSAIHMNLLYVQDGVVWFEKGGGYDAFTEYFYTYDPAKGSWIGDSLPAGRGPTLCACADGAVAFVLDYVSLSFVLYDPRKGYWVSGFLPGIAGGPTVTSLNIQWETIQYTSSTGGSACCYYDNTFAWQQASGGCWTTPYAGFVPQYTANGGPQTVWLTDMSMGMSFGIVPISDFTWNFGDGSPTLHLRSTHHDYSAWKNSACSYKIIGINNGTDTEQATITLDNILPSGSITINGGAQYTHSTSVTLNLSATDNSGTVAQMYLGNEGQPWQGPFPYSTAYNNWQLLPGNGMKTVWAFFVDAAGNESSPKSAIITFRMLAPPSLNLLLLPN